MATTINTVTSDSVTRAMALQTAIEVCTSAGTSPDVVAKLQHMLEQVSRPSKKTETEASYRARMRGQRAGELVNGLDRPVTAREFLSLTDDPEILSVQGATAALRRAVSLGLISSWLVGKKSNVVTVYGSHRTTADEQ